MLQQLAVDTLVTTPVPGLGAQQHPDQLGTDEEGLSSQRPGTAHTGTRWLNGCSRHVSDMLALELAHCPEELA